MKKPSATADANSSAGPCRTCAGQKTITIQAHKCGTSEAKSVTCPACRGTGRAGYLTK